MDIILIPGMWLDGSSWEKVTPALEEAGHTTHSLTLPGLESKDADRSDVTRRDHVNAVVAAIDSVDTAASKVVIVGHSAGGGIAHAAVDARPEHVERAIYVGGFPIGDGVSDPGGYPAQDGEIPLPDWSGFDEEDLADLDDDALADFRARAVPWPERVATDSQQLSDERRYEVPVTVISTEFTSEMLKNWIDRGMAPVQELTRIHDVTYIDLPTGHWPQFTRPQDLAQIILSEM